MARILIAGATGTLGRAAVRQLKEQGDFVRGLGRYVPTLRPLPLDETFEGDLTNPESLEGCCDGVDTVLSCAGASMRLDTWGDQLSFAAVDFAGNRNLLAEAQRAGVGRFVYVSLYAAESLLHTEYARAHEGFVALLRRSGLPFTVIRPTGFFSFFGEILRMAQKGQGVVIGSGATRTNPVHEEDVAAVCAAAVRGTESEISVGGPDTFTRREIVELAFNVMGKPPRIRRLPPWVFRSLVAPVRLLNPRIHALMAFGAAVSVIDIVAPAVGRRDLRAYFRSLADQAPAGSAV
jgi:uncharacterized protein YbjT (DUF2867 family)